MGKRISIILLFFIYIQLAQSVISEAEIKEEFKKFKLKYEKNYTNELEDTRYLNFKKNFIFINEENSESKGMKLAVGPFADLSYKEFSSDFLRKYKKSPKSYEGHVKILPSENLPDTVNWLASGNVVPPKDQGRCGSCYIFGTIAGIESARSIKYNQPAVPLSEQQVLDCDLESENLACDGGWEEYVYEYLIESKCIAPEKEYKYKAYTNKLCDRATIAKHCTDGYVTNWKAVLPYNEKQLMAAVALHPVPAAIYAGYTLMNYGYGIIPYEKCAESNELNHLILIIGYGSLDGVDYWICKNSWGREWGTGGYFFLERNPKNINYAGTCLIATHSTYPQID